MLTLQIPLNTRYYVTIYPQPKLHYMGVQPKLHERGYSLNRPERIVTMGIHLHYRTEGTGYPLILLHGNGESGDYFENQLSYFSQWFCVIAPDTRGHGGSPRGDAPFTYEQFAADLSDFMDEQAMLRAHILGFSDGAITALLFALNHENRIGKLVLNGANLDPSGLTPEVHNQIMQDFERLRANAPYEDDEQQRSYELVRLMAEEPHIAPAQLRAITVPTLVIAGDHDMIRDDHTRLIAASIPHCELAIIPGGHFIARDNAEAFNERVKEFLLEE